ncbi:MAG: AI-2E family transporter [Clostridiales bacterium]|nr:AI-2E family transporter [Clostridiales bacterium]
MKFPWNKRYLTISLYALGVIVCAILSYVLIVNFPWLWSKAAKLIHILNPVIWGFAIAYLLCPLFNLFGRAYGRIEKKKPRPRLKKLAQIVSTYVVLLAAVTLLGWVIVPQMVTSVSGLVQNFQSYAASAQQTADSFINQLNLSEDILNQLRGVTDNLMNSLLSLLSTALPHVYDFLIGVGNGVKNVLVGLIISVYVLWDKERFAAQVKKVLFAVMNREHACSFIRGCASTHRTFSGFINGKILDSLIIGVLCFLGMSILGMPFPMLISVIVGVTNVIPYFGPFLGAIPSAVLVLLEQPDQTIWFCLFILILQQFDGNILGPKILGESTGLSSFWVIVAILVGGGLFGVLGMFVSVPVFAVLYSLFRSLIAARLREKKLPERTESYCDISGLDASIAQEPEADKPIPSDEKID